MTLIETKEGQSPVSTTSTYDARDRLLTETTGSVTLNYGYNANGSLTTKHEGSVLQSEQVWDVRGRLAGLKDGSGNWLSQYRYTPDGIRSAATEGGTTTHGRTCLLTRKLTESSVRFVQLTMDGWDHHDDIRGNIPKLCKQTDQPVAELLKD